MMKRLTAAALMLVMLCSAFSVLAAGGAGRAPSGYNTADYDKMSAFLEIADDSGVKNGKKLSDNYKKNDPTTWTGIEFTDGQTKRIKSFTAIEIPLVGELDLSGLTSLETVLLRWNNITKADLSGCTALKRLTIGDNKLTSIDISGCPSIIYLQLGRNSLTSVDLTGCTMLRFLYLFDNLLSSLDLSNCPLLESINFSGNFIPVFDAAPFTYLTVLDCADNGMYSLALPSSSDLIYFINCRDNDLTEIDITGLGWLNTFDCANNDLREIDLSGCPNLRTLDLDGNLLGDVDLTANEYVYFDRVYSMPGGTIGFAMKDGGDYYTFSALPETGMLFRGWYYDDGEIASESLSFKLYKYQLKDKPRVVIARFSAPDEYIEGDADGDGAVNGEDALLVLRHIMGLITIDYERMWLVDINHDGVVNAIDALIILRKALGII
ncbi:MAG: leucine-rich repeat domain-containing protein [Clostridia bacterium]|nr:leucine-rich repeat domain-containing protein [Clostridia bacterium]